MADHDDAIAALEKLECEVADLGYVTRISRWTQRPFLNVLPWGEMLGQVVFVYPYHSDGPSYLWANLARHHPLYDPTGAAKAIGGDIEQERTSGNR